MIWIIILILALFFFLPLMKHKHQKENEAAKKRINNEAESVPKRDVETPYDFIFSDNEDEKDKEEKAEKVESLSPDENYDDTSENVPYEMPLDALNILGDDAQETTSDILQNLPESEHDNEAYALGGDAKKKSKKISGKEMIIYSEIVKTKF